VILDYILATARKFKLNGMTVKNWVASYYYGQKMSAKTRTARQVTQPD
jgi:hypothetical protein